MGVIIVFLIIVIGYIGYQLLLTNTRVEKLEGLLGVKKDESDN